MLSKGGHRIDILNNGIEALMIASKKQYDVILMDVQMPNMSGIDATKKIRRLLGPVAETPIVALTANAMVGDRETYLEAGMDDYLSKPIDPNYLSAVLTRQSGRNSVAGALAESGGGVAAETTVACVMTIDVITCSVERDAGEIAEIMSESNIRYVPIVKKGVPVDIFSIRDIVRFHISALQSENCTLRELVAALD